MSKKVVRRDEKWGGESKVYMEIHEHFESTFNALFTHF